MTYFGVLLTFVVPAILVVWGILWVMRRKEINLPEWLSGFPAWRVILLHAVIALVYTTPWDNYLVATGVWYYNPELVTGIRIGWVPIEEYTFFILQAILAGSWLVVLAKWLHTPGSEPAAPSPRTSQIIRWGSLGVSVPLWIWSADVLLTGYMPGNYLALILIWALPPIEFQLFFGGDILWRYRKLVFVSLASALLFLSVVDGLAIGSGTWTISPNHTFGLYLFGVLPVEEFIFFLATNTLLVFGVTLFLARRSQARVAEPVLRKVALWTGLGALK